MKSTVLVAAASLAILVAAAPARAGDIGDNLMRAAIGIAVERLAPSLTGQSVAPHAYAPQAYAPRQMAPSYGSGMIAELGEREYAVLARRYGSRKVDICMQDRGCRNTIVEVLDNSDRVSLADLDHFFARIRTR